MDKLAQFVSKSFDVAEHSTEAAAKPAAKNWLVPDSPPPLGVDLRLKEANKARWLEAKTPSPRNSYSSSSSPPIDLEDSKSCPEIERIDDSEKRQSGVEMKEDGEGDEKKLCE